MRSKRGKRLGTILGSLVMLTHLVLSGAVGAETLAGAIGSSSQWGSGWLDLAPPVDFTKGERLKLLIGGTANKILVRLLPREHRPIRASAS